MDVAKSKLKRWNTKKGWMVNSLEAKVTIETQFKDAMFDAGIVLDGMPIADGQLHRFYIDCDSRGTKNGWYVFYSDGIPSGSFGSWKTGQ